MSEIIKLVSKDNTQLVVEIEGNGPPLVLLHGITENRSAWDPFVPELRSDFKVIRLDFRGHGESDSVDSASIFDLVGDVIYVVGELDLVEPAFVGHSLGGFVATIMAAIHKVSRVVCVDQRLDIRWFQLILRKLEDRLRGDGFVDALLEEGRILGLDNVPIEHRSRLYAQRRQANQSLVLALWEASFSESAEAIEASIEPTLRQLNVPYLALHGETLNEKYHSWLRDRIPHACIESWSTAGHWLHLVEPRRFLERTRKFLLEGTL